MKHCGEHHHNTAEGAKWCRDRRAVRAFDRQVARGLVAPERPVPVHHWPARADASKPITVYRFTEGGAK